MVSAIAVKWGKSTIFLNTNVLPIYSWVGGVGVDPRGTCPGCWEETPTTNGWELSQSQLILKNWKTHHPQRSETPPGFKKNKLGPEIPNVILHNYILWFGMVFFSQKSPVFQKTKAIARFPPPKMSSSEHIASFLERHKPWNLFESHVVCASLSSSVWQAQTGAVSSTILGLDVPRHLWCTILDYLLLLTRATKQNKFNKFGEGERVQRPQSPSTQTETIFFFRVKNIVWPSRLHTILRDYARFGVSIHGLTRIQHQVELLVDHGSASSPSWQKKQWSRNLLLPQKPVQNTCY